VSVALAAAIAAAVRGAVLDALNRGVDVETAVARATAREIARFSNEVELPAPERPAQRLHRENAELLAQLDAMGGGRDAAMKIARRTVVDPNDAVAVDLMAQRIRRLRRNRTKRAVRVSRPGKRVGS
jgi:hypothetical protein